MKPVRLGINGFGRIGRIATRIAFQTPEVEVVAINSRADIYSHAHLLKYDSNYGTFAPQIKIQDGILRIGDKTVWVFQQEDPLAIPWKQANVDIVLEATGVFTSLQGASKHLKAGAKRVIITAPAKDKIATFCMGVNHHDYQPARDKIVSNASCTTNCLAPVAMVLDDNFGITKGFMTTIHSYTDSQNLMDNSHRKSLRLARSAANNIIPTTTGASRALGLVLPQLSGKILSSAIRVPTPVVSLIDLVVEVKKSTTAKQVNQAFATAAEKELAGILKLTEEAIVSSDVKGTSWSALIDGLSTEVMDKLVKVKAWYDNEWGYASRLIDLAIYMKKKGI